MKEIEIIPIARQKLERRGISENWIIETLNSSDQTVAGYGGRKVAHRLYNIGGKEYLLRVVYEEGDKIEVVTAYLTSQTERYWEDKK